MKINQKLIDKIAKLSQLNLNKEEKIKMEKDLNKTPDPSRDSTPGSTPDTSVQKGDAFINSKLELSFINFNRKNT